MNLRTAVSCSISCHNGKWYPANNYSINLSYDSYEEAKLMCAISGCPMSFPDTPSPFYRTFGFPDEFEPGRLELRLNAIYDTEKGLKRVWTVMEDRAYYCTALYSPGELTYFLNAFRLVPGVPEYKLMTPGLRTELFFRKFPRNSV